MKKLSEKRKKWIEHTAKNDRSYKAFLYNRFFVFALLGLFQLFSFALLVYLFVYNSTMAVGLQLCVFVLEIVFVLHVINKDDRQSLKMSWILLIVFLPAFGVAVYLFYGGGRPTLRMQRKIQRAQEENTAIMQEFYRSIPQPPEENTRNATLSKYLETYGGYPAYYSGEVEYYKSGEEMFPAMLQAINSAKKYILLEYFIIAPGEMWSEILKILLEKASLGVQVRILYDDFGCMVTLPPKYDRYLESLHENIKCMTFNNVVPFFNVRMNNRDHRKMLVIDGEVAFTGGINLADEYIGKKRRFGYWKDTGVKITGASVAEFAKMFFYLWNAFRKDKENLKGYLPCVENDLNTPPTAHDGAKSGGNGTQEKICIQPYDDCPLDGRNVAETVYTDIVDRAKNYVWFFTPYLVLDDHVRMALCKAAMRGVDVRLVTPGIPDKKITYRFTRANYAILLKAGVKIYEYTPGFIHAKSVVSDDESAVVGSINLDYRSLYHHFENAVYFTNCQAVLDLKRDAQETFAVSKECSKEYPKRSIIGRLIDSVLRVFETFL
jgi:cardiolipin synthase